MSLGGLHDYHKSVWMLPSGGALGSKVEHKINIKQKVENKSRFIVSHMYIGIDP